MLSKARRRAHRQLALARAPNVTTVTAGSGSVITAGGSATPGSVQPVQPGHEGFHEHNWWWNSPYYWGYPYNSYWPYTYATYWPTYYAAPLQFAATVPWGGNYWGYPTWGTNYWGYRYQRPVVSGAVVAAA